MLAALLFAQAFIGAEIVSAPLPPRNQFLTAAAPAIAMARDERGIVIAWTARDETLTNRLYVARLDSAAQVTGGVHEVPTSSSMDPLDVDAPSMAKSATGPGFVLAWIERSSSARAVFCELDPDLQPTSPRVLTATAVSAATWSVIVRSGKSNWIAANGLMWRLNADGSLDGVQPGILSSDMVAITDFPVAVGGKQGQVLSSCSCGGGPHDWGICPNQCATYQFTFTLQVVWLYSASAMRTFSFDTSAQPAIQSDGKDLIAAWFDGAQKNGGAIVAWRFRPDDIWHLDRSIPDEMVLGTFGADSGPTRPDIATDGERYVVVWRTKTPNGDYDVVGASIDGDDNVTFLPIATSPADERDPSIIAVGDGRFLVAYEKIAGGERRLAGRFVDFGNRRHAVR